MHQSWILASCLLCHHPAPAALPPPPQEAVSYTRALMVAWLENNFRRMDAGTAVIVEKFTRWAADKENDLIHSIEFDIKLA